MLIEEHFHFYAVDCVQGCQLWFRTDSGDLKIAGVQSAIRKVSTSCHLLESQDSRLRFGN